MSGKSLGASQVHQVHLQPAELAQRGREVRGRGYVGNFVECTDGHKGSSLVLHRARGQGERQQRQAHRLGQTRLHEVQPQP